MEGDGDDQGSGWLEVKKRHRTSSKVSIQKVSGESSNKRQIFAPFLQAARSHVFGNLYSGVPVQSAKEEVSFVAHSSVASDGRGFSGVVANHGIEYLDKVVINSGSGPPKAVPCTSVKAISSEGETKAILEVIIKENADIVPKIRWGDLEDVALFLPEGCEDSSKIAKTEYLDVGDGMMQGHAHVADSGEPLISNSPCTSLQGRGELTTEEVQLIPTLLSSGVQDESPGPPWKEVIEIPSEVSASANVDLKDPVEALSQSYGRISREIELEPDGDLHHSDAITKTHRSPSVEVVEKMTVQETIKSQDGSQNVSEVSITNETAGMVDDPQGINSLPHLNNGVKISVDASMAETEGSKGPQHDTMEGADLGEGEQGESKERFRERLWCFLFENLNRSVDELYLLCELECDMEQMNEAMLVLEEATSDFRELKSRVEHFENTKRITSQSCKDSMPVNVKADHRRPHALSWENLGTMALENLRPKYLFVWLLW